MSWVREARRGLSGPAMGICCLALVWQYVIVGILIGVAVAAVVILLGTFSG